MVSLFKSEIRRKKFYSLIDSYFEHGSSFRSVILSKCYPPNNIKFPEPVIGFPEAYKMIEKYYFDDIFFCLHMFVASELKSRECLKNIERFANVCNRTFVLMNVITFKLKEFLSISVQIE